MSKAKFYRMVSDPTMPQQWHMRSPLDANGEEVDARIFTTGMAVDPLGDLTISPRPKGTQTDFNLGDFDMMVTAAALNDELEKLVGPVIQRIPVRIKGCSRKFEIMNIVGLVKCIDETKSEFAKWGPDDGRPDKVGQYRRFTRLRIDGAAAAGHHLFRIEEWDIAPIASSSVKALFERLGVTGVKFNPVN